MSEQRHREMGLWGYHAASLCLPFKFEPIGRF